MSKKGVFFSELTTLRGMGYYGMTNGELNIKAVS